MADLKRIKNNVAKMVAQGAPEGDIDAYIQGEGVTVDAVKAFKPQAQPTSLHGVDLSPEAIAEVQRIGEGYANRENTFGDVGEDIEALSQGAQGGFSFNFGDEIGAALTAPLRATADAVQGKGFDLGRAYNFDLATAREVDKRIKGNNPVASTIGEIGGGLAVAGLAGGQAVNAPTLLGRAGQGATVAGAQGAAHGAGAGETLGERGMNAAIGGAVGGVIGGAAPYVGDKVANALRSNAQNKITNQAIKSAPTAKELKGAASAFFNQADGANITYSKAGVQRLWDNIGKKVGKFRPNSNLDPKATGALQVVKETVDDVLRPGSNVAPDLTDLHMMRQAAQRAAMSADGRDAMIAGELIDTIDDFVKTSKPGDIVGTANSKEAVNQLFKGISTWSRARKTQLIEDAIELAQDQASGFENGLRINLRKILRTPALSKGLSEAEKDAIQQVVRGTTAANFAKLVGKFGFGHGNASNMLGGSVGMLAGSSIGGLPGGLAAAALGKAGRVASEKLTESGANRAMRVMATEGIQSLPAINKAQPKLVEMLLRGAGTSVGR